MVEIFNKIVKNCKPTINTKLCKRRLPCTFYSLKLFVIFRSLLNCYFWIYNPKIGLVELQIVRRYQRCFQSWKSDNKQVCRSSVECWVYTFKQSFANGVYLYLNQIYSLQLKTSGANKIVIFKSTSLNCAGVDFKSQSWKSGSKRVCRHLFPVFLYTLCLIDIRASVYVVKILSDPISSFYMK